MNRTVRTQVKEAIRKRGLTQSEMAERLGVERQYISLMLTGKRGGVPDKWQELLDELGLELTLQPKELDPLELPKSERDELLKRHAAELADLYQPGGELVSFTEEFVDDDVVDYA